jgi:uncharacterized membrane protein YhaH (DUF805 family)
MSGTARLVFAGEVLDGFARDDVKRELRDRLNLDDAKLDKLFSGGRVTIKRGVPTGDAQRHVANFALLGARLLIEDEAPAPAAGAAEAAGAVTPPPAKVPAATPPKPVAVAAAPDKPVGADEIVCPKCGERQPKRELCRACATNMPMGIAAKIEAEEDARALRQAERDARLGRGPKIVEDAGEAPPIWGFGFTGRLGRLYFATANVLGWLAFYLLLVFLMKQPGLFRTLVFLLGMGWVMFFSMRWCVLRLHDFNRSGLWSLLLFVPIANVVLSLLLMFWPGSGDDNDHGEPPRPGNWLFLGGSVLASVLVVGVTFGPLMAQYRQALEAEAAEQASDDAPAGTSAGAAPPSLSEVTAALTAMTGEYASAPAHKAFAMSSSGAWGMKAGAASAEDARAGALLNCDAQRRPDTGPCKVINLNGKGSRTP